ncbi:S1 RNA-binding domain-containing protein [Candidatus Woesearchaeota archaeon]|nr:S1 RNA-binding domain-containing protein [Candidatus Woesearchaeota archaeon]
MLYRKQGFPQEGELVMCNVTKIHYNSVFVRILEYDRNGMIHISEISPGRIRNIYEFVEEGKIIVCKVLRVNEERGYIDLSLRRVSENQRKMKVNEVKQENLAEKIVEFIAKQNKKEPLELYDHIKSRISKEYDSLFSFFESCVKDESLLKGLGMDETVSNELQKAILQRIKPKEVDITGKFLFTSYEPNGVDVVKKALLEAETAGGEKILIRYAGGGSYKFIVTAGDYKEAESVLERATDAGLSFMKKNNGIANVERDEKK